MTRRLERIYRYVKIRTNPNLHDCDWRCWFWGMIHPGLWRLTKFQISLCIGVFVFGRSLEVALFVTSIMLSARILGYEGRNLEIIGLPILWSWIEMNYPKIHQHLPADPPLRSLDVKALGHRQYWAIKIRRWLALVIVFGGCLTFYLNFFDEPVIPASLPDDLLVIAVLLPMASLGIIGIASSLLRSMEKSVSNSY